MKSIRRWMIAGVMLMMMATCSMQMQNVQAKGTNNKKIVYCKSKKYSYSDMKKDIQQLAEKYPDYCSYKIIGKTRQGRNIYDLMIGNPEAKKSMLVVSTLHAREYVCSATTMRIAEYYLDNYDKKIGGTKPCKVFDKVQLHIVAMANPDGVYIAQHKRSNWKANSRGVDLNRNFPCNFMVRGKRGAEGYSGKKAASEKETQAVIKITKELKKNQKLCAQVNYHAMGNIVFGGYGGKNNKVKKETKRMYRIARNETGYADSAGYSASSKGNYREYVMYTTKIPSITIEVGSTTCPVAYYEYNKIFEKNKNVLIRIAKLYK